MKRIDFLPSRRDNTDWLKTEKPDEPALKNPPPPMTQIVGIVYQEGILVASESQYTAGRQKTFDAEKISIVKFKNGDAIFAECGKLKKNKPTNGGRQRPEF